MGGAQWALGWCRLYAPECSILGVGGQRGAQDPHAALEQAAQAISRLDSLARAKQAGESLEAEEEESGGTPDASLDGSPR